MTDERQVPGPTRRESWIYLGGVLIAALHVLDDNVLQPRPGTSAADHVVSTLVPLGVLLAAAAAHHRVRPGWRGAIALATGFLAIVFGWTEAGYHTFSGGPSDDDYSGLLTGLAGVVLISLGARTLWRSRRLDDRRSWRYARRTLIGGVAVLALYEVGLGVFLGYLATHVQRTGVPSPDLGAAHENVTLTTADGLRLTGWYVPSTNGAAVIVFAGRTHTRAPARMLASHGYGVLLFDRRGEGTSDGDGNVYGWGGEEDIFAAVRFLQQRPEVDPARIGGIGYSVGGELMLQAAAQSGALAAVVSEGAGTRTFAEEREELPGPRNWVDYPLYAVKNAAVAVFSNTAPPPKLTALVPRIAPRPVFLIWAPNGGNAETMNPEYHRLAGDTASIWEMPGASHIGGLDDEPEEYERRVIQFFDQALLTRS